MPEELMIEHCSPTMAGLKTANLFACSGEDAGELNASIRDLNRRWTERGVCVIPVKQDAERTLIYMYRPERRAPFWRSGIIRFTMPNAVWRS